MMFSRVGRSISQISRSWNVLSGGNGGRSLVLTNSSSVCESRYAIREAADDDKLVGVILKRYFGSVASNNFQRNDSSVLSDTNSVLANPRNRRFFHCLQTKKESRTERVMKFITEDTRYALKLLIIFLSSVLILSREWSLFTNRLLSREINNRENELKNLEKAKANGWKIRKKASRQGQDFSN